MDLETIRIRSSRPRIARTENGVKGTWAEPCKASSLDKGVVGGGRGQVKLEFRAT